jgi:hypothetical protein
MAAKLQKALFILLVNKTQTNCSIFAGTKINHGIECENAGNKGAERLGVCGVAPGLLVMELLFLQHFLFCSVDDGIA